MLAYETYADVSVPVCIYAAALSSKWALACKGRVIEWEAEVLTNADEC